MKRIERRCPSCGSTDFGPSVSSKTGTRQYYCRSCRRKRAEEYASRKRRAPGNHTQEEWEAKCKEYKSCPGCGRPWDEIPPRPNKRYKDKRTKDHIIPITQGGSNAIDNIRPLCYQCNFSKGNRLPPLIGATPANDRRDRGESFPHRNEKPTGDYPCKLYVTKSETIAFRVRAFSTTECVSLVGLPLLAMALILSVGTIFPHMLSSFVPWSFSGGLLSFSLLYWVAWRSARSSISGVDVSPFEVIIRYRCGKEITMTSLSSVKESYCIFGSTPNRICFSGTDSSGGKIRIVVRKRRVDDYARLSRYLYKMGGYA
jgi:5-methylcytosine-specific restriction endonuclease McrA